MNIDELLKNPLVLGGVGGVAVILVLALLFGKRGKKVQGRVVDDTKAKARAKLRNDLRGFSAALKKAVAEAAPVMRKIEQETEHKDVVGHWRKTLNHKVAVRAPDFNAMKGTARLLGQDAQVIIDLDATWRQVGKQVADYNAGKHDASKIPITFAKEFERDLQKMVLLSNMCVSKYGL